MTSLAYIFTMEKKLVKIVFGRKFFICEPIFKIFAAHFTTFRVERDDKSHFASGVSEQGDMQKDSFQMMMKGE